MRFLTILFAVLLNFSTVQSASADSCWWHNGSLMRLQAFGNQRNFYYENPREGLWNAGVRRGTLLFNGTKSGNWYSGLSRVFSSSCPGNPLEYFVEGPVAPNQTQVTMQGTRERSRNCASTGQVVVDTLVFTYARDC
ncbi:hypothetical protein AIOL_004057 [Candidatus Rhodobacter oscarellae]|uniref:Uncharacterized protein n=1 Tax=Candidatus Rhodobacter oscarellae TaxID=1675527 RepID=A0A0J9E8U7_9RHOB|nr:hypothetical protein [Candidatus Rhodobacter lobularis]KMW59076.1 hypothetical protein AIOL_004057 [Candidatus Rhodobacter lobularis]